MTVPTKNQCFHLLGRIEHGFETRTEAIPALEAVLKAKNNWKYEVVADTIASLRGAGPEMQAKRRRASVRFKAAVAALQAKAAPVKAVETPASETLEFIPADTKAGVMLVKDMAALESEVVRLRAENKRLLDGGGAPAEIPEGLIWCRGHLKRPRR